MKNILIIYLATFSLWAVAHENEVDTFKNRINFQIIQPLFGEYQFGYERQLSKKVSLEIMGSIQQIRNASEVRIPGFNGTLYTENIYTYESLRWAKFNRSYMIELSGKYYFIGNTYVACSIYYRNCEVRNGNWRYGTPKSSDNQYLINADIDTFVIGAKLIVGERVVFKLHDKIGSFIEPYAGLGYRYTKGNIFFHKFEEKISTSNNKYNFSETRNKSGITIHLGVKIGIAF